MSDSTQYTATTGTGTVTTATTATTASSIDDSMSGLVREKDPNHKKKGSGSSGGLFNKLFKFGSRKGRKPSKPVPSATQVDEELEKEAEMIRARRAAQIEQDKIQEHYRRLKEQQHHQQQQFQHLQIQKQREALSDDKFGHYMNYRQIQEQLQIYAAQGKPPRLMHATSINHQNQQQQMQQLQSRPPPLPPSRPPVPLHAHRHHLPQQQQTSLQLHHARQVSSPTREVMTQGHMNGHHPQQQPQQRPISNYFEYETSAIQPTSSAIYEQRYHHATTNQHPQTQQQAIYGTHLVGTAPRQVVAVSSLPSHQRPEHQAAIQRAEGHYGTIEANALFRRQLSNHRIAPANGNVNNHHLHTAPRTRQQPVLYHHNHAATTSPNMFVYHQQGNGYPLGPNTSQSQQPPQHGFYQTASFANRRNCSHV